MRWTLIFFVSLALRAGQDVDTIVLQSDASDSTLVSQISDPHEAEAFLKLYRATDPQPRFDLANRFLADYPQSWLLAQVFDAAARSAIDLSRYDDAIRLARFSLRLAPENASLLVLLANVETQLGQFAPAIADASAALDYLDAIERPPAINQKQWTDLKPQLKASAFFARGKARLQRALASKQNAELPGALDDLDHAAAWNPNDAEIFYLRGIVELQLNKTEAAKSDLAFAWKSEGPLKARSAKILSLLCKDSPLDRLISTLPPPNINAGLRARSRPDFSQALTAGYIGPQACRTCHPQEFDNWRKTGMARMLQPYRPENIIADFASHPEYREGPSDAIRMGIAGRPYFEVFSQNQWQRFYVDFTIGSKWQQGYATKAPDGRLQVLPIEYNLLRKQWVNYWKIIDPPGSPRAVLHDFPKLNATTNYQQNCAICHTSQLKSDLTSADPMQHAQYLQPGIDCEMCHGPGALHARRAAKGDIAHPDPAEPPFDFRHTDHRAGVRVCAQCHQQSAVREIGPGGEMNFSTRGTYVPQNSFRAYDAFSRKAFYKDGRFRETTFIVEAFSRSACYRNGTAQCASCHSPHLPDFEHNLTSLKSVSNPNGMCLGCHPQYRNRESQHSRHAAGTEASECVTCHMPRIVNAVLFKARSHQIEIPTADLTERFGQEESPNVCLTCHAEKNAHWASEQLASWQH